MNEEGTMTFARWVFRVAGAFGLVVLAPQYFMVERIGNDYPPPLTHLEYFYGFVGVALAWQVAFLVIGHDPARFRPLMPVAVLEKASFGVAVLVLYSRQSVSAMLLTFGLIDLAWGCLFAVAFWQLGRGTAPGENQTWNRGSAS
jgi:hypothetical protein